MEMTGARSQETSPKNIRKVKNIQVRIQVHGRARIKTRAGPTMRKQARDKDLKDLDDRFGSVS